MMKRISVLSVCLIVALGFSACWSGVPFDEAAEIDAVLGVMDEFAEGIEDYDLDKMLDNGDFLAMDFVLTIQEGAAGNPYEKSRQVLWQELTLDEAYQLNLRNSEGYSLYFAYVAPTPVVSSITHKHAVVEAEFRVEEEAPGFPRAVTDIGTIQWNLMKVGDKWVATSCEIVFTTIDAGPGGLGLLGAFGL